MIHEERVRQMMKLAVYDENKKRNQKSEQYFRRDYIAYEMIKSFFCGSIGFFLIVILAGVYLNGKGLDVFGNQKFYYLLILVTVLYVVFMGVFLALTYMIYSTRYEEGRKEAREYHRILKKVNELYEQEENAKTAQEQS